MVSENKTFKSSPVIGDRNEEGIDISLNPALKIHSGVEEVKDGGKEEYIEENGKKKVFTMAG